MRSMLHKLIKPLLIWTLYVIVATVAGLYVHVLLCDIWQLPWEICQ